MTVISRWMQTLRRRLKPLGYGVVYGLMTPRNFNTMNMGYAPVTEALRPKHPAGDQGLQYELYWQTFNQLAHRLTRDQVVCEIACGRGGGLAFLRHITQARLIGLERSAAARRYAHKQAYIRSLAWPLRTTARGYLCTLGSVKHGEMLRDERAFFILRACKAVPA